MKFGLTVERGQKQQDFQNEESGQLQFDPGNSARHRATPLPTCWWGALTSSTRARPSRATRCRACRTASSGIWDLDGFAQDSWKLRPNFTLEYGVRFGKWTNNEELNGEGGYFTRRSTTRTPARSSIPARTSS